MCVYSVEADDTRNAKHGDRLVVHQFSHATGLSEADRPGRVACCMSTGMTARFDAIPQSMREEFSLPAQATATFEEGDDHARREDAFLFTNNDGKQVRVAMSQMIPGMETTIVPAMDEVDQAANDVANRIAAKVAAGSTGDTADGNRELVATGGGRPTARRRAAVIAMFMILILA